MFTGTGRLFEDPAVGRHLRTGQFILATHQVPRTDPLSFTHAGEPWTDYEWAFEATIGELYRAGGLGLVDAFCTTLFAATLLGVYRMLMQGGASLVAGLITIGFVFLTLYMHLSVRPLLFTYLFFALVVEVWYRRTQPLPRNWLFLPIIFVAWANLHAGWAAALAFWALALFGRLVDRVTRRVKGEDAPIIPWLGLAGLCAIAASFNPWGWQLYPRLFGFATSYQSFALWDEYARPNFAHPNGSAVTIVFVLGVLLIARLVRRTPVWRADTLLPIIFFLCEGLKAQRHVLLLIIVAALPVALELTALFRGRAFPYLRDRLEQFAARQRLALGDAWLAPIFAVLITLVFLHSAPSRSIEVGKSATPQLIAFLRAHAYHFTRPLVTTWNAGPLLWNMRPDFRVSFDDRGDFYGDAVVFSFVDLYNGRPGWQQTLGKGRYDSAILDPYLKLNDLLKTRPDWHEAYRDKHAVAWWHDAAPR